MPGKRRPLIERLLAKVHVDNNGCWIFVGAMREHYGVIGLGGREAGIELTHRVTYSYFVGPIGDLHIDHLCRVRLCCNPAHLDAVTQAENNRRANLVQTQRTHCQRGHEYPPRKAGSTQRTCLACVRARYLRKKAVA